MAVILMGGKMGTTPCSFMDFCNSIDCFSYAPHADIKLLYLFALLMATQR